MTSVLTTCMQYTELLTYDDHLNKFCIDDLSVFDREIAHLTGIAYAGVSLD